MIINSVIGGTNTTDANATAEDILLSKTAYVNGNKVTGSMPNNVNAPHTLSASNKTYTIPNGYHAGGSTVNVSGADNLVAGNIKKGISAFGVTGTLTEGSIVNIRTSENGSNSISFDTNFIPYYFMIYNDTGNVTSEYAVKFLICNVNSKATIQNSLGWSDLYNNSISVSTVANGDHYTTTVTVTGAVFRNTGNGYDIIACEKK